MFYDEEGVGLKDPYLTPPPPKKKKNTKKKKKKKKLLSDFVDMTILVLMSEWTIQLNYVGIAKS